MSQFSWERFLDKLCLTNQFTIDEVRFEGDVGANSWYALEKEFDPQKTGILYAIIGYKAKPEINNKIGLLIYVDDELKIFRVLRETNLEQQFVRPLWVLRKYYVKFQNNDDIIRNIRFSMYILPVPVTLYEEETGKRLKGKM